MIKEKVDVGIVPGPVTRVLRFHDFRLTVVAVDPSAGA
jgi:hypothetical protein